MIRTVCAVGLLLIGYVGTASAQVVLDVTAWKGNEAEPGGMAEIIEKFEAANPDIDINFSYISKSDTDVVIPPRLQSGNPPDVMMIDMPLTKAWGEAGLLLDYGTDSPWYARVPEGLRNAITIDDAAYVMPLEVIGMGLYTNLDLLKKAGIDAEFRVVDTAQYQVRVDDFDFDIITAALNFFPPPGPELRSYYGTAAADERGTGNMGGIKNEVVDELIEKIINAPTLEDLQITTRAMDRVLLWNDYVIPQFYNGIFRLAYWNRFGKPETLPRYGTGFPGSWWIDSELDSKLDLDR